MTAQHTHPADTGQEAGDAVLRFPAGSPAGTHPAVRVAGSLAGGAVEEFADGVGVPRVAGRLVDEV